jgi:hypothetical protein
VAETEVTDGAGEQPLGADEVAMAGMEAPSQLKRVFDERFVMPLR